MPQATQQTTHAFRINKLGSEAVTRGVRVRVQPFYLPQHSIPVDRRFVYAYRIEIMNESPVTVQLNTRRWHIVDALGRGDDVHGEGVVGVQPFLEPGESFEYASHCILRTRWGTMEGTYQFVHSGADDRFDVHVGRFYLVAEDRRSDPHINGD